MCPLSFAFCERIFIVLFYQNTQSMGIRVFLILNCYFNFELLIVNFFAKLLCMSKCAVIHVEKNENILDFARFLTESGWTILSANKTEDLLKKEKIPVTREQALIENGLYLNDNSGLIQRILTSDYKNINEQEEKKSRDKADIYIICMNLMPSLATNVSSQEISGLVSPQDFYISTILRNSIMNYKNVLILTDPADYKEAMIQLRTDNITKEFRLYLASKALNLLSAYDSGIYFSLQSNLDYTKDFPNYLSFPFVKHIPLHGGSNPQQVSCLYKYPNDTGAVSGFRKVSGKELNYNIISDVSLAWEQISSLYENLKNQYTVKSQNSDGYNFTTQFTPLTGIVFTIAIKYKSILGAALSSNVHDSFINTYKYDSNTIKDVTLGCSSVIDESAALEIVNGNFVAIVAPEFTPGAKQILSANKNIRLIPTAKISCSPYELELLNGGMLFQSKDSVIFDHWYVKTKNRPSQYLTDEMAFGMLLAMGARSYTCILLKNNMITGIAQACKSAEKAVDYALMDAKEMMQREKSNDSVADLIVCDSSVTLTDSIKELIDSGVKAIIQTGFTSGNDEFIDYCNEHEVVMIYTLMPHISY